MGGVQISPLLLTRLVNDVGNNPDQLSILQHALNRTWACWRRESGGNGPLALEHYEAIGTMSRALDQHAERAFRELEKGRPRSIAKKLLKALTDKATDSRGTRRPTKLGDLCKLVDASEEEVTAALAPFRKPSRSFLMPPAGEELERDTVIDISHESLMRVWRRLDRWASEEARSAATYRRLSETAALYRQDDANLWRDAELENALTWRKREQPSAAWAARYAQGFEEAMRFLDESKAAIDREAVEETFERRWRTLRLLIFAFVLALFMGFGVGFGDSFWNELFEAFAQQSELPEKVSTAIQE